MSKRRRNSSSDNEENLDDQTYRPTRNTRKPAGYYSEKTFAASLDQALIDEQRKRRLDGDATENAYEVLGWTMYPERMYLDGELNPVDPAVVQESWRKEAEEKQHTEGEENEENNPANTNTTNGHECDGGNANDDNNTNVMEPHSNEEHPNKANGEGGDEPKRKRRRVGELPADPKARNIALKRAAKNSNHYENDAEPENEKEGEAMKKVNSQLNNEMETGLDMLETQHLNYPEDLAIRGLDQMRATIEKYVDPYEDDSDWQKVKWQEGTYINCDVRYTHLPALGSDFDVVSIDPPWRIRGGQHTSDEKTMFNNSNFALQYNTMSNEEIMDLDVGSLSKRGFIFLWTINSQFQFAFECLNRWGYNYVDRIIWIKKTINNNLHISQGFYILHSSEICLIGVKKDPATGAFLEFIPKVNNDVIFAETRKKSQKPEQLYHIIERMFPGARKVELFGRNHNIRKGWLTLGNQLGEYYDWDHDLIQCDKCSQFIRVGHTRWKNRAIPNKDYCDKCFKEEKLDEQEYFKLSNLLDEMAFHEYYECNGCKVRPLWGIRFSCADCPDYDLCEECYDKKTVPEELVSCHDDRHRWECFELPQLAGGFSVHRYRCAGCETFPIIGPRLRCLVCVNLNMCQKCFFSKKEPRSHDMSHDVDLILEPQRAHHWVKCDNCGVRPIIGARYKCNSCFNFDLCEECYNKKVPTPPNYVSHKPTHTFSKIIGEEEIEYADAEADDKSKSKESI